MAITIDNRLAGALREYAVADLPIGAIAEASPLAIATDEATGLAVVYWDSEDEEWRRTRDDEIARTLPLILIGQGQSNFAAAPSQTVGFSEMTGLLGSDLLGWNGFTGAFSQIVDGSANARANLGGSGTGQGPGGGQVLTRIARAIADETGQTVRTFALAYPSQPIAYFLPASATRAYYESGAQHATLNNYNLMKSYFDASGLSSDGMAFLFGQGEADAGATQATYQASLVTLIDAVFVDYPGCKVYLTEIVGDSEDRLQGGAPFTGVRAAQRAVVALYPGQVFLVPTKDLAGNSAYRRDNLHFTTAIGFETVADRFVATMKGEVIEDAASAPHIHDLFDWDEILQYVHGVGAGPSVVNWYGNDGSPTNLTPYPTNAPGHIASDSDFGGRSVIEFDASNSEAFAKLDFSSFTDFVFYAYCRLDTLVPHEYLVNIARADQSQRLALDYVGDSNTPRHFENGSGTAFDDVTPLDESGEEQTLPACDVVKNHSILWVVDASTICRLYIDGTLVATETLDNSATLFVQLFVGSLVGNSYLDGRIACVAWAMNPTSFPTDEDALAMHSWAKVEFKQDF